MIFPSALRKAVLLLLMLLLPLQGVAAAYAPLQSAFNPQAVTAMPCHDHSQATGHGASQSSADHSEPVTHQDGDSVSHLCCHQVLSCASVHVMLPGARKFSDVPRFVLPLATLFIPDSPDRPPRG